MRGASKTKSTKRIYITLTAFLLFAVYLLINILRLDLFSYDYYKNKTYDQVTTSSALRASRGAIYDANMNLLACTNTSWRIFISTKDIRSASREDGVDYGEIIAEGLANILSLSKESLKKKITSSNVLDVTVKKSATEEEYLKTIEFSRERGLEKLIFTEATSSRSYPNGTLAAHVLGFTGSDNQGLYGLEYYYDDILSGEDGYYVYAKDANGNALDTEYSTYFPATDGYSLVTTIDSYLQSELEAVIEKVRTNHDIQNRVTAVAMDTSSGAILAMATTSPFDPNSPFVLDDISASRLDESGYAKGSDEYNAYKTELMQIMWSNKAISETYEPGSTFKIITVAAALENGAVEPSDTFSCSGYCQIGGYRIKCHKTTGHGSGFDLAYGLQMSCNPCMIEVSRRLGAENFYSYVKKFGYLEKTGIDLPSEASTIFHSEEGIGVTELATASFGQRFKVSVINHITAIATVANGGVKVTPYIVDKVIDSDGRIISEHKSGTYERVISEETARTVSEMLIEGVSGNGGAKNAAVSGYDIAAKTGTSQKFDVLDENGNSYLRISSTVAYAVDSDSGIAVIIVADEPNSTVKYGSVVAAPYVSEFLEKALPYLEHRTNADPRAVTVDKYVGMSTEAAKRKLTSEKIAYETVGDGNTVVAQVPAAGETFDYNYSKVILYTEKCAPERVTVPNLIGLTPTEAVISAINAGLNVKFTGADIHALGDDDKIIFQSLTHNDTVARGTVITIRALTLKFED